MRKLDESCENVRKLDESCENVRKLDESCENVPKLDESCENVRKRDEKCENVRKLDESCESTRIVCLLEVCVSRWIRGVFVFSLVNRWISTKKHTDRVLVPVGYTSRD